MNLSLKLCVAGLLLVLQACTSTEEGKALNGVDGIDGASELAKSEQESSVVIKGKCPRVSLRHGTAFYRAYAKRKTTDPDEITYQASLAQTTRQCRVEGNNLVVNVVAAGRALAGPKGKAGQVKLPIRVAVVDSDVVLYSQLQQLTVDLPSANPTAQFLFSDPNVIIPIGAAGASEIFIGFDDGPK